MVEADSTDTETVTSETGTVDRMGKYVAAHMFGSLLFFP